MSTRTILGMGAHQQDYAHASAAVPLPAITDERTFMGYHRADGKVGTRNYIGHSDHSELLGLCGAFHRQRRRRNPGCWMQFPNVDGIVPIVHGTGCGMSGVNEGYETLFRTLSGYAQHPNFGGILLIGLGCEVMQVQDLVGGQPIRPDGILRYMTIQNEGGTRRTIERGLEELRALLAGQQSRTRPGPGQRNHRRYAMWRLGWLFRHHGEPGAGLCLGSAGAPRWHHDPVGNLRNLRG